MSLANRRIPRRACARRRLLVAACWASVAATPAATAQAAPAAFAPHRILVKYVTATSPRARAATARAAGTRDTLVTAPHTRLL
jgi:hypothetical protein